ncbi:MAG: hypothetical protein Q8L26_01690 [Candidatus Omnitrophota bacterium]|nr:hypothetical protein [Candidatus Omnitrophota bacterium]
MKENILKGRYLIKKIIMNLADRLTLQQEGYKELDEVGVTQLLKLANNLKASVAIDESSFKFVANVGHRDARSFYIYSVISEVAKVAIVNMRMLEFLRDSEEEERFKLTKIKLVGNTSKEDADLFMRVILEGLVDEQNFWERKLTECLCDLISFSKYNEEQCFKLFIAANELSDALYANSDFLEFFNCCPENFERTALDLLKITNEAFKKTDKDKRWFLNDNVLFDKLPKHPSFIRSYRDRFKEAILLANNGEKVVLGFTYQVGYGGRSESMHFGIKGPSYWNLNFEYLKDGIFIISMLGLHILNRAYSIIGVKPTKAGEGIFDTIVNGSGASQALFMSVIKDHDIGDLVSIGGEDLSEILDIKTSKYGYKAYRVKYLVNPLLPTVLEEWWPARYIQKRIIKKNKARQYFEEMLKRDSSKKEIKVILEMPDELIFNSMKKVFIDLARRGILQKDFIKKSVLRKKSRFGHKPKDI